MFRDKYGNGIPNRNENPTGIQWEWKLMTKKLGTEIGRNGN